MKRIYLIFSLLLAVLASRAQIERDYPVLLADCDTLYGQGKYIDAYEHYSVLYRYLPDKTKDYAQRIATLRQRMERTRDAIDQTRAAMQATIDQANKRQRAYEKSCLAYALQQEKLRWLAEDKATLHELAAEYGVSAERIRQLEKNAMEKIKATLTA